MNKDTQLPAEVVQRINEQAATAMQKEQERLQNEYPEMEYGLMLHQIHGFQDGHIMCATEYAIKLQQLQQDYDFLKLKYDNILATESGHESKTENVWQSGYAAGHEAASSKNQNNMNVYDIINKGENGDL